MLLESTALTLVVPIPTFDVVLIPALFVLHAIKDDNELNTPAFASTHCWLSPSL